MRTIQEHSWKYYREQLHQIKTIRELTERLPQRWISDGAMILLAYLCLLPILASITSLPTDMMLLDSGHAGSGLTSLFLSNTYPYSGNWYHLLMPAGLIGLLVLIYNVLQSHYTRLKQGYSLRHWLLSHPTMLCLSCLLGWSIISFLLSANHYRSFFGTGYRRDGLLSYFLYAGIFSLAIRLNSRQIRVITEIISGVCTLISLLCITERKLFEGLFHYTTTDIRTGVFNQYNHFGYFLVLCLAACVLLFLTDGNYGFSGWKRKLLFCARTVEFWLIADAAVYNGTRGAFLGILAALAAFHVLVFLWHPTRRMHILFLDLIFLITFAGLNNGNHILERMSKIDVEMTEASLNKTSSGRIGLWKLGIRFALEKPLFGYGPDNLGERYLLIAKSISDRPHNELIQIAAMLGFPALFFYVSGLLCHFIACVRQLPRLSLFQTGFFVILGGYLVSSLFGNTMFNTTPYFYMMLGFSYAELKRVSV